MHRHGYKGRKFGRETDQRRALIKGLADSLVLQEKIETTLSKAKEIVPYIEKLITKAKKGDLHNRRQVIAGLQTTEAAHKLVDEIAPKLSGRVSGHVRVTRTTLRRGDNTQMATVSFVDDLKEAASSKQQVASKATTKAESPKPKAEGSKAKPATKAASTKPKATSAKKETK